MKRKKKKNRTPSSKGFPFGVRIKGGVRFDPEVDGFIAIVHTWDDILGYGEPKEWRAPQVFQTEDEAMRYYKTSVRPMLEQMKSDLNKKKSNSKVFHRKLEQ